MKIGISGSSGFIGRALLDHLKKQGHNVVVLTCGDSMRDECGIEVRKFESYFQVQPSDVDSVECFIHLAGLAHKIKGITSHDFMVSNTLITSHLTRVCIQSQVNSFIYLSSIKALGNSTVRGDYFQEDSEPKPQDDYGLSKLRAEQALIRQCSVADMSYVIIRSPLVYGRELKGNLRTILKAINKSVPMPISALSKNKRSVISIINIVNFICECMTNPVAKNRIFVPTDSGEPLSTGELIENISLLADKRLRAVWVPRAVLKMAVRVLMGYEVMEKLFGDLVVKDNSFHDEILLTARLNCRQSIEQLSRY